MKHLAALAAVATLAFFASGIRSLGAETIAGTPTVEALKALVKEAAGPEPANEHVAITFHQSGIDGTENRYKTPRGERTIVHFGSFDVQTGNLGGHEWRCNANTQCVLVEPNPDESTDTYETTSTRVQTPFDAFVLAKLTKKGDGTRKFIDPVTYHVVREDVIVHGATITTTFDQFITLDGYTRPWHWKVEDGTASDSGEYHVEKIENGATGDDDIAIPKERDLVVFPNGTDGVELPVSYHDGKFIVRVMVGTRGLDLVLDTGASGIVLDDDVARSLGLRLEASQVNAANAGAFVSSRAILPLVRIGALSMSNVAISTAPHTPVENPGVYSAVGFLGFDFINNATLALDYDHQKVTAYPPATFVPPLDPDESVIPVRLGEFEPMTDADLNDAIGRRFIVDTGAAQIGFLVFDYFAHNNPKSISGDAPLRGNVIMYGVGGYFQVQTFLVKSLEIGKATFKDYNGFRTTGDRYGNFDGLIGPTFLRFFTVYVDYPRNRMYLVPNEAGRKAMHLKN